MKVIIISDVLDEPYELDSTKEDLGVINFGYLVRDKVAAILETESMKGTAHTHGIFEA